MDEVGRAGSLMDEAEYELAMADGDIADGLFTCAAERIVRVVAHLMAAQALLVSEVGGVE